MAGSALLLELPLVDVLVAIFTFLGLSLVFFVGLVFYIFVAFFAFRILMFPDEGKFSLGIVIKKVFFPIVGVMAFLADIPKFVFMDIFFFVAIDTLCGYRLVLTVSMTFFALCVHMFAVQLVPLILLGLVLEQGRLPTLQVMAGLAAGVFELTLVGVFMAVGGVASFIVKRFVTVLGMALFTLCVHMLPFQLVPFVFFGLMLKEGWLPALYVMT
jgi:hypothetical protein